jgi:hypothetical protein
MYANVCLKVTRVPEVGVMLSDLVVAVDELTLGLRQAADKLVEYRHDNCKWGIQIAEKQSV